MPANKILVIDDEYGICDMVSEILEENGKLIVYKATSIQEAEIILNKHDGILLVILDIWLGTGDTGINFLDRFKKLYDIPVLVMSGHGSIGLAVDAVKLGAEDFLEKPFTEEKLLLYVNRIIDHNSQRQECKKISVPEHFFIGNSDAWQSMHKKLARSIGKNITITGDDGVGKNDAILFLISKLKIVGNIYNFSDHNIDKIQNLRANDVAVVHLSDSSNINKINGKCNIFTRIKDKKIGLRIPSLSERGSDIKELFDFFVKEASREFLTQFESNVTLSDLQSHKWIGNVLELKMVVTTVAMRSTRSNIIERDDFLKEIGINGMFSGNIKEATDNFQMKYLNHCLQISGGNKTRAAQISGMERSAFHRKSKSLQYRKCKS